MSRASTALAIVFFVTSLTLGLAASRNATSRSSLIQEEARRRATQRPAATGQQPGAPVTGQPATGAPTTGAPTPAAPPTGAPTPAAPATGAPTTPAPTTPPPSGGN